MPLPLLRDFSSKENHAKQNTLVSSNSVKGFPKVFQCSFLSAFCLLIVENSLADLIRMLFLVETTAALPSCL